MFHDFLWQALGCKHGKYGYHPYLHWDEQALSGTFQNYFLVRDSAGEAFCNQVEFVTRQATLAYSHGLFQL